ncbi:hypothetical protein WISP_105262 [Willisornis vidua]|uniref:Uncharacterized protein n=1 Tax=Willisornis vidua TaxID=1566151 RepID=A0ABQ9CXE3_9PASS|nr:hypothetical protein WISP_105262 [Willisornis vidua]
MFIEKKCLCFKVNCYGELSHNNYCLTSASLANTPKQPEISERFWYILATKEMLSCLLTQAIKWTSQDTFCSESEWGEGNSSGCQQHPLKEEQQIKLEERETPTTELKADDTFSPHHLVATGDPMDPNSEKCLGRQVRCMQRTLALGEAERNIPSSLNEK